MTDNVFFGGVPTDPEVNKLRKAYPEADLEPGQEVTYRAVERLIGVQRGSNRFRTITNRWRSIVERETGEIVIGVVAGVGFKVLDNTEKIDLGQAKLASAVRSTRRAFRVSTRVDTEGLSDEEKARLLTLQKRSGALLAMAQVKKSASMPKLEAA